MSNQHYHSQARRAKSLSRGQGCVQVRFLLLEPSCLSCSPGTCNHRLLIESLQFSLPQTSLLLLPLPPVLLPPPFFYHWCSLCCFNHCLKLEKESYISPPLAFNLPPLAGSDQKSSDICRLQNMSTLQCPAEHTSVRMRAENK